MILTKVNYSKDSAFKIFLKCAIPSVIAMFFASIATMVDGIFVGQNLGVDGLSAVNLITPIFMLLVAFAGMIAVGGSVQVSMYLGNKNKQFASRVFTTSVILLVLFGLVFGTITFFSAKSILSLFDASATLIDYAVKYIQPFAYTLPLLFLFFSLDNFLRVCKKIKTSLLLNILAALINILLDWLFLAHLGLGIEFAAYATAISFSVPSIIVVIIFATKKLDLHYTKPVFYKKLLFNIFFNGSSEFLSNSASSFISLIINGVLLSLAGAVGVAAYSAVLYIDSIVQPLLFSLSDSVQPAISYNIGKKDHKKISSIVIITSVAAAIISLVVFVVMLSAPKALVSLFAESGELEMISLATSGVIIMSFSYLVIWLNIAASSFFTSVNRPMFSLIIMMSQIVVFPLIFIFILPNVMGVNGVFYTMLFSIIIAFIIASVLITIFIKKKMIYKIQVDESILDEQIAENS